MHFLVQEGNESTSAIREIKVKFQDGQRKQKFLYKNGFRCQATEIFSEWILFGALFLVGNLIEKSTRADNPSLVPPPPLDPNSLNSSSQPSSIPSDTAQKAQEAEETKNKSNALVGDLKTGAGQTPSGSTVNTQANTQSGGFGMFGSSNCETSERYGASCSGVGASQLLGVGLLMTGGLTASTVQSTGMSNYSAYAGTGSNSTMNQAAALEASARTAQSVATKEASLGAITAAAAAVMLVRAQNMSKVGNDFKNAAAQKVQVKQVDPNGTNARTSQISQGDVNQAGYVSSNNQVGNTIISRDQLNQRQELTAVNALAEPQLKQQIQARSQQNTEIEKNVSGHLAEVGQAVHAEQKNGALVIGVSAAMVGFVGASQLSNAIQQQSIASSLQRQAEELRANKNLGSNGAANNFAPPPLQFANSKLSSPTSIRPGPAPSQRLPPQSTEQANAPLPDFQPGFNTQNPTNNVLSPTPSGKEPEAKSNNSSGNPPNLTAGSTKPESEEAPGGPQGSGVASGTGDYNSSNNAVRGGSGSQSFNNSNSSDKGEISQLLSQFLPKKEDANQPSEGILKFGVNQEPESNKNFLYPASINIFDAVHNNYQDAQKSKKI